MLVFFGISGSIVSIYLFYSIGLYSESILYVYYVAIGIYGYLLWKKKEDEKDALKVQTINLKKHLLLVVSGIMIAVVIGFYFKMNTDAVNPYLDAFTTVFSFIASFLEAKKILSSWFFWIIINTTTIILYLQQSLFLYLLLTIIYVVFSVIDYRNTKKCMAGFFSYDKKYKLVEVDCSKIHKKTTLNPKEEKIKHEQASLKFIAYQKKLKKLGYDIEITGKLDQKTIKAHNKYLRKKLKEEKRNQKKKRKKDKLKL